MSDLIWIDSQLPVFYVEDKKWNYLHPCVMSSNNYCDIKFVYNYGQISGPIYERIGYCFDNVCGQLNNMITSEIHDIMVYT